MSKPCGKCVWFEGGSSEALGDCHIPVDSIPVPASYYVQAKAVLGDLDYNCPFWEEK